MSSQTSPRYSIQNSNKLRQEVIYPAVDAIMQQEPHISSSELIIKVKARTGRGSNSIISSRYHHNRRKM